MIITLINYMNQLFSFQFYFLPLAHNYLMIIHVYITIFLIIQCTRIPILINNCIN